MRDLGKIDNLKNVVICYSNVMYYSVSQEDCVQDKLLRDALKRQPPYTLIQAGAFL